MTLFSSTIGFFASKTTMHGVNNFVEAEHGFMRAMWGVVTISMFVLATMSGLQVTYSYLVEGEETTEVSYDTHLNNGGLPLPMITICPSRNPFVLSRMHERQLSSSAATYLLLMVDKASNMVQWHDNIEQQQLLAQQVQGSLRGNETLADLFNYLSPSCEEMVASCAVYSKHMNGSTCCSEVFSRDYAVYYQGRCISSRFSSLFQRSNQTRSGDYSGLSVIIQENREAFTAEQDMRVSMVPLQDGNRVILNPWYQLPHEALSEQTYIADVGSVTRLAVSMTTVDISGMYQRLWPWSEKKKCDDIPKPWTNETAPSSTCHMDVFRSIYRTYRNCTPLGITDMISTETLRDTAVCQPEDMMDLQPDELSAAATELLRNSPCRPSCQRVHLDAVIDSTPFKRQVLEHSLVFGSPTATPERNLTFSVVTVFFPNLISHTVRLSHATLMQWLSAFGGQMSLFIGASVITMLEITALTVRVGLLGGKAVLEALWGWEERRGGEKGRKEGGGTKVEPAGDP